jgi:hypothetical protein
MSDTHLTFYFPICQRANPDKSGLADVLDLNQKIRLNESHHENLKEPDFCARLRISAGG